MILDQGLTARDSAEIHFVQWSDPLALLTAEAEGWSASCLHGAWTEASRRAFEKRTLLTLGLYHPGRRHLPITWRDGAPDQIKTLIFSRPHGEVLFLRTSSPVCQGAIRDGQSLVVFASPEFSRQAQAEQDRIISETLELFHNKAPWD